MIHVMVQGSHTEGESRGERRTINLVELLQHPDDLVLVKTTQTRRVALRNLVGESRYFKLQPGCKGIVKGMTWFPFALGSFVDRHT